MQFCNFTLWMPPAMDVQAVARSTPLSMSLLRSY